MPRFAALADPALPWLPAGLFNVQDRAAARAAPPLRVAVLRTGVAAHVEVGADGEVQGPQVQWLLAVSQQLGLTVTPVVLANEAAVLQALRDDRADLALALPPPPPNGAQPGLAYSLGTGAQPLAWVVLREVRPVALDRARIAHLGDADPAAADRLRRHHPAATLLPQPSALQALQAVADRRADAFVGALLPLLDALQQTALPGLELRQVWPGAAGHRHLVLGAERAALLPAFNKAIAAWRATGGPHRAVLKHAQRAAQQLRAPLALPADLASADSAVMDRVLKAPFVLSADASERLPLAERSSWRVGVLRSGPAPSAAAGSAPVGAVGPSPAGAVGPSPAGAVGPSPAGAVGPEPAGAAGQPPPAATHPTPAVAAALSGLDAQGHHTGMAADLLQELALRLGVLVQVLPFDTLSEMLDALRGGRIDALPLLEHTPQRAQGLAYSLPWLELPQVLVGADDGPLYWGLDSLRGRRLAMATTHPLRAELQRLHPGLQLVDADDGAGALALVRQGQADAALEIKPVVQQQLASAAGQGLRVLGDVATFTARYRVALPEAQRHLLPVLDAALADIDGEEQQRSLRRWLVQEPAPSRPWWHSPWWPGSLAAAALLFAGLAAWGWARWWHQQRQQAEPGRAAADAFALPAAAAEAPAVSPPPPGMPPAAQTTTAPLAAGSVNVHLGTLLQAVVTPLRRKAETMGLRLVWVVDEVLPARICSDPAYLAELVELLLARALAMVALQAVQAVPGVQGAQGVQGRVVLKVRRARLDNGHPALHLAFNASAMAPAEEALLDPRVQRAHDLAVALGGDLVVRSRVGLGHAVSVTVPLRGPGRDGPGQPP